MPDFEKMQNDIFELNCLKDQLESQLSDKDREYLKLEAKYDQALETIEQLNDLIADAGDKQNCTEKALRESQMLVDENLARIEYQQEMDSTSSILKNISVQLNKLKTFDDFQDSIKLLQQENQ